MSTSPILQVVHPYVESRPDVQGGRPVIKGTRFPVSSIVQNHRRGQSVDDMLREFAHLSAAQIYDALSFYHDHRDQIDQEIADLNNLGQVMHAYPPTLQPTDDADQGLSG